MENLPNIYVLFEYFHLFAQKKTLQMVRQNALFKRRRNIKLGAAAAPGLYRKQ